MYVRVPTVHHFTGTLVPHVPCFTAFRACARTLVNFRIKIQSSSMASDLSVPDYGYA